MKDAHNVDTKVQKIVTVLSRVIDGQEFITVVNDAHNIVTKAQKVVNVSPN